MQGFTDVVTKASTYGREMYFEALPCEEVSCDVTHLNIQTVAWKRTEDKGGELHNGILRGFKGWKAN